jgi:hypothetical protein
MKFLGIEKSPKSEKKWRASFQTDTGREKHTDFGDSSMKDYTQHKDEERAERYRSRHKKDLQTGDPTRAGYLSYYVLWSHPSLRAGLDEYRKRFF